MLQTTLKPRMIYVLHEGLSRTRKHSLVVNDVEVPSVEFSVVIDSDHESQF